MIDWVSFLFELRGTGVMAVQPAPSVIDLFPELLNDAINSKPSQVAAVSSAVVSAPKSYAAVTNCGRILPAPDQSTETADVVTKGGFTSVRIPQALINKRLALCSNSLIGRLILQKGDTPYKLAALKDALSSVWGIKKHWRLISLGRGYYHILLGSQDWKNKIFSRGTVTLKPGTFRVQPWQQDFNPAD